MVMASLWERTVAAWERNDPDAARGFEQFYSALEEMTDIDYDKSGERAAV